jgi:serine protease
MFKQKLVWGALLALVSSCADAADWTVGTATAVPGQTVQIPLSFSGDGVSQAAEIDLAFDEARLTLPVAGGEIPGASVAGACVRSTSKTVTALIYSAASPLPAATQIVCNLPFTVRPSSRAGRIALRASSKQCASGTGSELCTLGEGWIDVLGNQPPEPLWSGNLEETNSLSILLSASQGAPSVNELVAHDYEEDAANAPLVALQNGVMRVRPPHGERAAGDVLNRLMSAPDSPEAEAERYVYADFDSKESRDQALAQLQKDSFVKRVGVVIIQPIDLPTPMPGGKIGAAMAKAGPAGTQNHLDVLRLPSAWERASGWGLVGVLDNGLSTNHPQLRSFTGAGSVGGNYVAGGNYLPHLSRNVGGRSQPVTNIEELQPSAVVDAAGQLCDPFDGTTDGWLHFGTVGHGTHVAGLVAANGLDQSGVRGSCVRCGIAAVKRSALYCRINPAPTRVAMFVEPDIDAAGITHLYKSGVQVINMSYSNPSNNCQAASNNLVCGAISTAFKNDVLMVASAGNARSTLIFPARDPRVASIGGLGESNDFWDESPGSTTSCPYPSDTECGSNYGPDIGPITKSRQEVVAPAKSVRSTFYPGVTWNADIGCGDEYGEGASNDGEGLCTGTSMSAPEMAGLYGLLRSINPLMRTGDPVNQTGDLTMPDGIRDMVTQTASRSVAGEPENRFMGFGIPDADAAVKKMLGGVRAQPVLNRVTPLFGMYSPGSNDYATVATPQLAIALQLYSTNLYRSVQAVGDNFIEGDAVPGYPALPNPAAGLPRARAMVLTTEHRPYAATPALVPLVLLELKRAGTVACALSEPMCRGDLVVALESDIQAASLEGYRYAGLQGYIYSKCTPEPGCIPLGSEQLHVKCTPALAKRDCAAFLESDRLAFQAAGYTANFLGASSSVLGYAYPVSDADSDGLVDALEFVIGTWTMDSDSDDDGMSDALEYPLAGTPVSDPCAGPNITCNRTVGYIFANGYE